MTESTTTETEDFLSAQADYDNPWKEGLELYLEQFLAFSFPDIHALIDWSIAYESKEQELQQVVRDAELGKRIADKLFRVWLKEDKEAWVLIHIEVQGQPEPNFNERMYVYNYRCFDRYRQPVLSLAVLGDDRASWRPDSFGYAYGGCEVSLKFPILKLLDYETRWEELSATTNPFAILVMAHLKTKATINQPEERKQWKWQFVRRLFERGYSRTEILELFRLIDWMMALPEELQQQFQQELRTYQEESKMPLISRVELSARQEGIEQGIEQGSLQNARESVIETLETRFEVVPSELTEQINCLNDLTKLKQLLRRAITIGSIEEFQQRFLSQGESDS